jgi:hypothetical protein
MSPRPRTDFIEFVWLWNESQNLGTPAHHRRIARWFDARVAAEEHRLLLMAFRGSGKSTLVGLFCAWWLHRNPETRILVLAADQVLAGKMVGQVRRIIERHPLCTHLLPEGEDAWAADRFTVARRSVLRDPSMLAQGLTGNITGARAEMIICDDVEVAGNCDTSAKREDMRERLAECEFVLVPGGTQVFVGTPHTTQSIYRQEEEPLLAGYRHLALPLLDEQGRSAWPERFPPDAIEALRLRVGPLHFARQMQLRAVRNAAVRLDPALIIRYREEPDYREANGQAQLFLMGRRMVSGGGFWDPSFGRPDGGDGSVLAAAFADGEGHQYLHNLTWLTHDPDLAEDSASQQCRKVAAIAGALRLPAVHVETNGIGKFLPAMLRQALSEARIACTVREHVSRRAKHERILAALDPLLAARRLLAHERVMSGPLPDEMAEWRPDDKAARDDALDAISGLILSEPVRLPRLPPPPRPPSWRGGD